MITREEAERMARIGRALVDGCLANFQIQDMLAQGILTRQFCTHHPTVRIEFEHAIAIGGIGETLEATKHKNWGDGPYILPLQPEDEFYVERITYRYLPTSPYNRRFEQRQQLKLLMGPHRALVSHAKNKLITKEIFLRDLTEEQATAIRRRLQVEPGEFWRACKGKIFLNLQTKPTQLRFSTGVIDVILPPEDDDEPFTLQNDKPKKQPEKFDALPKTKQLPLLRGLDDEPGQLDLFPDMTAS